MYGVVEKGNAPKIFKVEFLAGGLAGGFTTVVVYPLEFCQTRVSVDVGNGKLNQTVENNLYNYFGP